MFARFLEVTRPTPHSRVLDVGVTSDDAHPESNYFERLYPYKTRLVCAGTEDGSHLEQRYAGLRFVRITAGRPLPFDTTEYDIVFSNAVVEHVGGLADQRAFIAELCRVGRQVFVTTPNRWFPIEHHTGLPLIHYLPRTVFRRVLRPTPLSYWSHEEHLRILDWAGLRALFPPGVDARVERAGIGAGVLSSNLLAYTCRPESDR
jgi:hypothetical protein